MNDDTISVGVVLHESLVKEKKAGKTLEELYMSFFDHLDVVTELKRGASVVPNKNGGTSAVYMASDYSYIAQDLGNKNYRLVGDAACMFFTHHRTWSADKIGYPGFIDPFFSSGVHLAFVGALSASLSIISVIDGRATEEAAAVFHTTELKTAYTRFFLVVASGYKQMRGTSQYIGGHAYLFTLLH